MPGAPFLAFFARSGDSESLPLALFMFRVNANHPHHTLAVDDLALVANLLYRCSNLHNSSQFPVLSFQLTSRAFAWLTAEAAVPTRSFVAIHNPSAIQVVGRKLH